MPDPRRDQINRLADLADRLAEQLRTTARFANPDEHPEPDDHPLG